MDQSQLNTITNFIWNIADDVLRDVYVRGKYRDVILPMTVLRRFDAVLEPTKEAVLDMKAALDREKVTNRDDGLRAAAGQAFYNTSPFLLRDLKSRATQQKLKDDFEAYLDGFSPNVQDILNNFEFRNQIPRLSKAHDGDSEYSLITRSSDGQMLFLANMLSKMKHDTPLGSRIAEVHNGSSLFTGDAGQGESNIRRWIIESDWLEAIVALPLNMFYNTGIATYVWVLTNRKPEHRRGQVQLIDATQWFRPLRKNMGKKNCEFSAEDIQRICDSFLNFKETPQSKIFPNAAFGYWKVKVERPLRLHSQLSRQRIETLRFASGDEDIRTALYDKLGDALFENPTSVRKELEKVLNDWGNGECDEEGEEGEAETAKKTLPEKKKKKLLSEETWKRDATLMEVANKLREKLGDSLFEDHNVFLERVEATLKKLNLKPSAADLKLIVNAVSWRVEDAPRVIKKSHKPGRVQPDPLRGLFEAEIDGTSCVVDYEPDSELRDFEQIPLLEDGGIEAFIRREVLPYTPDAWIVEADTKIGYEVSFTRHFYKPPELRTLAQISADIFALEQETEGLLSEITKGTTA